MATTRRRKRAPSDNGLPSGIIPVGQDMVSTITPKAAADLLERNKNIRRLSKRRVSHLAEVIEAEYWEPGNGETIKLDIEGNVVDGQHRLAACVMADKPIQAFVMVDIPSVSEVDRASSRTLAQILHSHCNIKGNAVFASVAKNAMRLESGDPIMSSNIQTTSMAQIIEYTRENENLLRESYMLANSAKTCWHVGSLAALRVVWINQGHDADLIDYFIYQLRGDAPANAGDAAQTLRKQWIRFNSQAGTRAGGMHFRTAMLFLTKAFTYYLKGKPVHILRIGKKDPCKIPNVDIDPNVFVEATTFMEAEREGEEEDA